MSTSKFQPQPRIARRPRTRMRRRYAVMSYFSGPEFDRVLAAASEAQLALGAYTRDAALLAAAQEEEREGMAA